MTTEKPRKTPVRSPYLFPAYEFGTAIRLAEKVEMEGGGYMSEEALALSMQSSVKSSGFRLRHLTTRQFGLLSKSGNQLTTTPLAKAIFKPTSESEADEAKRRSFMEIPLFREVANRYKGQPIPPSDALKNILERELRVDGARVGKAERMLMDSARDTGVLQVIGGKQYFVTEASMMPGGAQPTDGHNSSIEPLIPSVEAQQPFRRREAPRQEPLSRPAAPSEGGSISVSELDMASLDEGDFDQVWDALGKIYRARGKRQLDERSRDRERTATGDDEE